MARDFIVHAYEASGSEDPRRGFVTGGLSRQALWDWLGAGILASLFACYYVATQSLILGSREGRWVFDYTADFGPRMVAAAAVASALSAAVLFGVRAEAARRDWLVVLAWIVATLGIQAAIRSVTPFSLERIFASEGANAFYEVTRHFQPATVLRDFDRVRASWPLHAQGNMPGKLMLVYALRLFSRQPAGLAWLTVVVSNAGALLMYAFVRALFGDRRTAFFSAVLYLFVPAKLYFLPLLNAVTPVAVLACAVLVITCLRTGSAAHAAALGLALFALVFYEPLPLVMGLLFAVLVFRSLWLGQTTWTTLLTQTAAGAAAWLAAYGVARLFLGFDLLSAFRQIGEQAIRFNSEAGRPYAVWIGANLVEFLFGMGVCQAVVFWAAVADGVRSDDTWRDRLTRPVVSLCAGLVLVLLVTDAIGVNRGEVIRLWIFLSCFFQIPAAYVCARIGSRWALLLVIAASVLQGTLGTGMIGFVVPN